jgi:hypothetical protein
MINKGYEYKVYNKLCPEITEPDSNIVEYKEDVKDMILRLIDQNNITISEKDLPF